MCRQEADTRRLRSAAVQVKATTKLPGGQDVLELGTAARVWIRPFWVYLTRQHMHPSHRASRKRQPWPWTRASRPVLNEQINKELYSLTCTLTFADYYEDRKSASRLCQLS